MKMSNETYDILKEIALTILPAVAVLYATLGKIWGLPYVSEVPATIMAISSVFSIPTPAGPGGEMRPSLRMTKATRT